ncbi:hypothetical protein GCM10010345_42430 [Streptomyces canarius]|uniref:Uncharacterized protein n=1 Tax=Streptomyces canarius TaxID=285453 RepID=A0ABQ3CQK8_9ACTN|nr:hypothetical protein GCM10010345_42430 [Streptomyces canarius]
MLSPSRSVQPAVGHTAVGWSGRLRVPVVEAVGEVVHDVDDTAQQARQDDGESGAAASFQLSGERDPTVAPRSPTSPRKGATAAPYDPLAC